MLRRALEESQARIDMTEADKEARPTGPYWEDRVYRYVSRLHRAAVDADETARLDGFLEQLVNGTMPDETYAELSADAKEDRRKQKQDGKQHQKPPKWRPDEDESAVNVADLKKRVYNHQVSRENMIKALEAMPAADREATITGLPPGLRRKLGSYLK